jgi:hypothetical protein
MTSAAFLVLSLLLPFRGQYDADRDENPVYENPVCVDRFHAHVVC